MRQARMSHHGLSDVTDLASLVLNATAHPVGMGCRRLHAQAMFVSHNISNLRGEKNRLMVKAHDAMNER